MIPVLIAQLRALYGDSKAVTALEYGLIAAGIAVVVFGGVKTLGSDLNTLFGSTIAGDV